MHPFLSQPDAQPASRPLHPGRRAGERQRDLLVGLVAANPGLHLLRAASLLGLNWNTCLHHARRLEGERRIVVRKLNGRLCLFDRREGAVAARVAPLLLREERNADLARAVLAHPGLNQKALAQKLGLAPSVVHRRLLSLEEGGLVQRVQRERSVVVFATSTLEAAWSTPGLVPAEPAGLDAPSWLGLGATAGLSVSLPLSLPDGTDGAGAAN